MKFLSIIIFSFMIFSYNSFGSESDVYDFSWLDSDKEVYVLQNRKFRKAGEFYIGGTLGKSLAGAFVDSYRGTLIGGFFFSENWGFELSYSKESGTTNKTHDAVNEQGGAVAFYRKVDTQLSAMLMWSPFYAKINTFNKIFYFDWLFGAGLSSVTTLDNRNEFSSSSPDADELTQETVTGFTWMTGWRFYINQNWSLRMDFVATHMNVEMANTSATDTEKRLDNKYNFNMGLNFAF